MIRVTHSSTTGADTYSDFPTASYVTSEAGNLVVWQSRWFRKDLVLATYECGEWSKSTKI